MESLSLNILQVFNASALVHGLIFGVLLWRKPENRRANRFLVWLMVALGYTIFNAFVLELQLYDAYPWLHVLPFTLSFLIGPAFYFYTKALTEPHFRFDWRKHGAHFAPVLLNYLHSAYHLVYGRTDPYPLYHNFTEAVVSYALVSALMYWVAAFRLAGRYARQLQTQLSTTDSLRLSWIRQLMLGVLACLVLLAVVKLVDYRELIDFTRESAQSALFPYRDAVQMVLALTLYGVGIGGLLQAQTVATLVAEDLAEDTPSNTPPSPNPQWASVTNRIQAVMQDQRLYLDTELDLTRLSEAAGASPKEISTALNQHLHKNFYTFVNEYRVAEVKKRLHDPTHQHLKILSIAFDCGFNSKATFQRIFKEYTGHSPREYRDEAANT